MARPWFASYLLGLLAVVVAAGCAGQPSFPPSAPSHLIGKPLPHIRRATLDGAELDTNQARGRPVVVKFFAEYCEPCKRTLPAAERLHRARGDVLFVGIAVDDYARTAARIVNGFGLTFPVVHDRGHALKGRFRVAEMPVTFVADKAGTVRWVGGPGQTERDLAQAIDAAHH